LQCVAAARRALPIAQGNPWVATWLRFGRRAFRPEGTRASRSTGSVSLGIEGDADADVRGPVAASRPPEARCSGAVGRFAAAVRLAVPNSSPLRRVNAHPRQHVTKGNSCSQEALLFDLADVVVDRPSDPCPKREKGWLPVVTPGRTRAA